MLLKKEYDDCRERQIPHRLFQSNELSHVIPFDHPEINNWRDSLNRGLIPRYKATNIILTRGVDDIWINTKTNQLIIEDYKSQSKNERLDKKDYLEDPYHEGYKDQMDFYAYLHSGMGFNVHPTSYCLVCNAKRGADGFQKIMRFDEHLVPYKWDIDWIEGKLDDMVFIMNQHEIPKANKRCKNCAYSD